MRVAALCLMCLLVCGCAGTGWTNIPAQPTEEVVLPPTDSQLESRRHYAKAQYWISRGNWEKGEELCWLALRALRTTDPGHAHGAMRNNMVRPLLMTGKIDRAIEMGLSALEWNLGGNDAVGIACSYMNLGDAFQHKGDMEKRDIYWEKARLVASERGLKEPLKYIESRIRRAQRQHAGDISSGSAAASPE